MPIPKTTERCVTFLKGETLRMFRFDCVDSGMEKAPKLRQIIVWYYRNNPPPGFKKDPKKEKSKQEFIRVITNKNREHEE